MFKSRLERIRTCPVLEEPALLMPAENAGGENSGQFVVALFRRNDYDMVGVTQGGSPKWQVSLWRKMERRCSPIVNYPVGL